MELFEQIRREYEHGAGTIQGVARKLGGHRRQVRDALANAMLRERKHPVRERPRLDPLFIDGTFVGDQKAPRKQRHTALASSTASAPNYPTPQPPNRLSDNTSANGSSLWA